VLNDATEPFWLWISKTTSPLKEKKTYASFMSVQQKWYLFMTNTFISGPPRIFLVVITTVQKMCAIPTNARTGHSFIFFQLSHQLLLLHAR
jgi:hypothetical protein